MIFRYNDAEPSGSYPRGRKSKSAMSFLSSIAHIAAKHNLDLRLLLDAFKRAWTNGESQCERLKVKRRKADQNLNTYLVTCDDIALWQFPIDVEILQETELLESIIPLIPTPIHRKDDSRQKTIRELRAKMKGITINARVIEIPPRKLVHTRYGFDSNVSNVLLADETGTIRLSLWNSQIDDVAVGDTVKIEKAKVATFNGELQLRISRRGTMNVDTSARERSKLIES